LENDARTDLIARAKAGSKEAFEKLLLADLPVLLAYCQAICHDFHTAQDAVQQTAIIAFQKLHLFFPEADFTAWLKAIARREALDARKKLARAGKLALEKWIEKAYDDPTPEAVAPEREALRLCLEALERRDSRAGRLVREHYFQGTELAEIAGTAKANVNTVKWWLLRARLALHDCVQRRIREALA